MRFRFFSFRKINRAFKYIKAYLQYRKETGFNSVPSASLRFRVHGARDAHGFLEVGKRCAHDIKNGLKKVGLTLDPFQDILDFGCGCGRTLVWLVGNQSKARFYGTDIDEESIAWCRKNFKKKVAFAVNEPLPPLHYAGASFDLVYSISVFTHINEDFQFQWLQELKRVMKPGGILLLSVHGKNVWSKWAPEEIEKIERNGFIFTASPYWKEFFPEWYANAYHTEGYIRDQFSRYFTVLDYIPQGVNNHQDLVILRKD